MILDSVNWLDELNRPDIQPMGQLDDVEEAYISFSSLYTTHVVSMQFSQLSQLLLGQAALQPELT